MADAPVVHIGENSPEQVAFNLMKAVLIAEKQLNSADRKTILDTYSECLDAVKGARSYQSNDRT
jgi:hypothetical protein